MESKRLGRTLPAVINGLSAVQAQAQGFIEVPSDADTASVANSESLFIGESDDESTSSGSRSGSPQKIRDVNGKAPQLNPAATPFDPKPTSSMASANPNPFSAATTFGKPSGTQIQSNPTSAFDSSSKPTNQLAHNPFEIKEPPKFNFFPPSNTTKVEESKGTPGHFSTKEPPKSGFFAPQTAPKTQGNNNGSVVSSFAPFLEKNTTFGQPSTTFPATTTPEPTKAVAKNPPTSTEAAVLPKPRSVSDQPAALSAPPVFSFGTSPLFGPAGTEPRAHDSDASPLQTSEEKSSSTATPHQKDAPKKPPTSTLQPTPISTPSSPFPPSYPLTKETNSTPAAPLKNPDSTDPLVPTKKPLFNSSSSQPSSIFPSSITPTFQSPLSAPSTKPFEAVQKPTSLLEPSTWDSKAPSGSLVRPLGPKLSQKQPTSAPPPLDPRSVALDKLSNIMLLEDNGIVQHFIEFTVGPIIKAAIARFDDESSWKEASQSSPFGCGCGERLLIGNRGMSCNCVGQEVH